MQHLTIAAFLFSLAVAAPSALPLQDRGVCTGVAYPRSIGFPINYVIGEDSGGNNVKPLVNFDNIPDGATKCQLEADFPAYYEVSNPDAAVVNVYAKSGDDNGAKIGSIVFPNNPKGDTHQVIAIVNCASTLSFQLAVANPPETVSFADTKEGGLTIHYQC